MFLFSDQECQVSPNIKKKKNMSVLDICGFHAEY